MSLRKELEIARSQWEGLLVDLADCNEKLREKIDIIRNYEFALSAVAWLIQKSKEVTPFQL